MATNTKPNIVPSTKSQPGFATRLIKITGIAALAAGFVSCAVPSGDTGKAQRADVRRMANNTLNELYSTRPEARQKIANSAGYAVFNQVDAKIFLAGGANGYGIAVNRRNGKETYMRMAGLNAGFGAGVKNTRVVAIFRSASAYNTFVTSGWSMGADANAGAALDGNGLAVGAKIDPTTDPVIYTMTVSGVSLSATLGAQKVWPDNALN
ncbi:MAG: hypothetical protein H8M99_03905 [Gloeobacteraceae cyanobacterium ES-bin-144]|nr:hypothetical protein [Verrucomicrobiales bacterium]